MNDNEEGNASAAAGINSSSEDLLIEPEQEHKASTLPAKKRRAPCVRMGPTGPWSLEEQQRFYVAASAHGLRWSSLAQHVGTRTRRQIEYHASRRFGGSNEEIPWTNGEHALFLLGWRLDRMLQRPEADWETIALRIKTKTAHQVEEHYNQVKHLLQGSAATITSLPLSPSVLQPQPQPTKAAPKNVADSAQPTTDDVDEESRPAKRLRVSGPKLRWTAEEHALFLEGIELYGHHWTKVAEHVGTRTTNQVSNRYRRSWSKEEHALYLKGLEAFGPGAEHWPEIAKIVGTRDAGQVAMHYHQLQQEEDDQGAASHDGPTPSAVSIDQDDDEAQDVAEKEVIAGAVSKPPPIRTVSIDQDDEVQIAQEVIADTVPAPKQAVANDFIETLIAPVSASTEQPVEDISHDAAADVPVVSVESASPMKADLLLQSVDLLKRRTQPERFPVQDDESSPIAMAAASPVLSPEITVMDHPQPSPTSQSPVDCDATGGFSSLLLSSSATVPARDCWNIEEHMLYLEGLRYSNKRTTWAQIAVHVGTRTPDEVLFHHRNCRFGQASVVVMNLQSVRQPAVVLSP